MPNLALLAAMQATIGDREFVAVDEWLGDLPYGHYVWIEVDGADIVLAEPWGRTDLDDLEAAGLIVRLDHRKSGEQTRTTYRFR